MQPCPILGNQSTPSGIEPEENQYLLNVDTLYGGYLDGHPYALLDVENNNPSACAQFVNHSKQYNVERVSFCWDELLDLAGVKLRPDDIY
jgi:hypothetical protein